MAELHSASEAWAAKGADAMRILVVEDDVLIGFVLETELTNAGHQVIGPVGTVERGLELAMATHPELALLNINLKDGGNGIELARLLAERLNCPSLFVSGSVSEARGAKDAALGFLAKPYNPAAVVESIDVVAQILHGHRPTGIPAELELFSDTLPTATRH
jgi:DNA-binding response OmpR family regulator